MRSATHLKSQSYIIVYNNPKASCNRVTYGAWIQFPFFLDKHLISQLGEVCIFRDLLANQPVCILACATFLGVVRTCEVELGVESNRNLLMKEV